MASGDILNNKRLYYIDWLRALVILSIIPYHAALTYLRLGNVYIKSPIISTEAIPFLIIATPLGDFFYDFAVFSFWNCIILFASFRERKSVC